MHGFGGRENIGVESENASSVVGSDGQVTLLATVHDELLNGATADVEWLGELCKLKNELDLHGVIDLRQLLEEAGEDDLLKRANVLLHALISADLGKDGRDLLANGQRMEVHLEDVVEVADLRTDTLEQALAQSILEENSTSGGLGHAQEVGEARVLVLPGLINIDKSSTGTLRADDRDGEGGQEDERRRLGHIGLSDGRVVFLGALSGCNSGGRLAEEIVVSAPCRGVEQVVLTDQENAGKLLKVVGHHDVLGWALAQAEQGVDVLDTSESLLPKLQLDCNVELLEASVQVALQSVGVGEVDGVHLGGEFGSILQVVSQKLAETAELGLAGILGAELEGLVSGRLVHQLEAGVVLEDVEDSAVCLPQELEPWCDDGAVGPVAGLLTRDCGEENGLWCLGGLKIVDVLGLGRRLEGGLDLVSLGLGFGDLLLGELDEALEDELNGAHVGVLSSVLVLVEAVLGELAFAEIDAEFDEEDHDGLEGGNGAVAGPLGGDMFVEEQQRIQREEITKQIEELKKTTKVDIDLPEDLSEIDSTRIRILKLQALEKEKEQLGETLRIAGKRIDHLERAYRKEEVKHLKEDYERQMESDRTAYDKATEETLKESEEKHKADVAIKHRLSRLVPTYQQFVTTVKQQRKNEFEKRQKTAQKELENKKAARVKEFRDRYLREKKEREEAERRQREEEERERQEAEAKAKAEEERRARMLEEKAKRDEERKSVPSTQILSSSLTSSRALDETARIQREREEAAEAKLAAKKAGRFGADRPISRDQPAEPSSSTGPPRIALQGSQPGKMTWREREALKAAGQLPPSAAEAAPAPATSPAPPAEAEAPKRGGYVPPAMRQGGGAPGGGWREREASGREASGRDSGRTESPATGGRWEPPSRAGRSFGEDRKASPASGGGYVPPNRRGQADGAPARDGERESAPPPAQGASDGKYRPGAFRRG